MSLVSWRDLAAPGSEAAGIASASFPTPIPLAGLQATLSQSRGGGPTQLNLSVVVIIVLLGVIFALSGLLHLVARCFTTRRQHADTESVVTMSSIQGQLQQFFYHESGVDQALIDTLPVFSYKSIRGLEDGSDCAVCLCEFQFHDKLRLLPQCSHAFHLDCIDTWLLSHSTCPLCRRSLLHDPIQPSPTVFGVIGDSFTSGPEAIDGLDMLVESERRLDTSDIRVNVNTRNSYGRNESFGHAGSVQQNHTRDKGSIEELGGGFVQALNSQSVQVLFGGPSRAGMERPGSEKSNDNSKGRLVAVQLGRFRISNGESSSRDKSDTRFRRCYTMGSFEYVLDTNDLQVVISPLACLGGHRRQRHRPALSECTPELKHREAKSTEELYFSGCFTRSPVRREVDLSLPGTGESSWVNLSLDEKITDLQVEDNCKEDATTQNTMTEKLLSKEGRANEMVSSGGKFSVGEISSRCRTFSLRLPMPDWKAKTNQRRRSLSEAAGLDSVVSIWDASGAAAAAARGQDNEGEGTGRMPSFRKWALQWLRG